MKQYHAMHLFHIAEHKTCYMQINKKVESVWFTDGLRKHDLANLCGSCPVQEQSSSHKYLEEKAVVGIFWAHDQHLYLVP